MDIYTFHISTRHEGALNDNTLIRHMADGWYQRYCFHPIQAVRNEMNLWVIALFAIALIASVVFLGCMFEGSRMQLCMMGTLAVASWFAAFQAHRKKRQQDLSLAVFLENYNLAKIMLGIDKDHDEINRRAINTKADRYLKDLAAASILYYKEHAAEMKHVGRSIEHSIDSAHAVFKRFAIECDLPVNYKKEAFENKDGTRILS